MTEAAAAQGRPAHLQITSTQSTERFVGTEERPRQVLHVTLDRGMPGGPVRVSVTGPGVSGAVTVAPGEGPVRVDVPLDVDPDLAARTGARVPVRVTADGSGAGGGPARHTSCAGEVVVAEPGWTMVMVSHFHYDPVWWNTQASYTTDWAMLGADWTTRPAFVHNAFALVEAHLMLAVRDPDYHVVLSELDYLKPYFDTFPEQRAVLRRLLKEGRVELVGGTYNEPNTNLTGSETTIRNLVYGIGYQRDVLGGDPRNAWQLDVFGHDPQFPGLVSRAGLTGTAWARGPHHQWGPLRQHWDQERTGDVTAMQFASEFEWISPSGDGVLTHYMPDHYGPGWAMQHAPTVEAAADVAYELFQGLKPVAATRNVLLPVGGDYAPPNNWVTEVHRWWAAAYVWPRFVCGTTEMFMSRVRDGFRGSGRTPSPQSRDMNPVYTGKDVSYIDTKQAQRAAEVAAVDAEKLATFACLLGAGRYPEAALDKVWRQLAFGAHHDGITGSESDQVYIDLLTGWREAHDLAAAARDAAAEALVARIDTGGRGARAGEDRTAGGDGRVVVVINTLSFERTDLVRLELGASDGLGLLDDAGAEVPVVLEAPGVISFVASAVPSMGWRTYRLVAGPVPGGWADVEGSGPTIANEAFEVSADPARGGTLSEIRDLRSGRSLLSGPGNELRVYEEYASHPTFGEGPWHLLPKGPVTGAAGSAAAVRLQRSPVGGRLVSRGEVDGISYETVVTLVDGLDRVDFTTRVLDHASSDRLLRVRFPVDLPGALPVSEVAGAVIGRGFGLIDADSAEAPWTLDNPANTWFGVGTTARVEVAGSDGAPVGTRAFAVAEVVVADGVDDAAVRDLVVALARVGVTATTSRASGSRYGLLAVDSNLPDIRILVEETGGPRNALVAELESRVGDLPAKGTSFVAARAPLTEVWVPNADLRELDALPALVVRDLGLVVAELERAVIRATVAGDRLVEGHTDGTVALLTYGLPGFAVDPSGGLNLSLMRSCTGWPSGVWIDPPRRTAPDGSAFQLQHWTHEFRYALVASGSDWRAATLPARGQEFSSPLLAVPADRSGGVLPPTHSLLRVEPERAVLVSTVKPAGNPIAHGRSRPGDPATSTIRLVEATGLGTSVRLLAPATPVTEAFRADLLEVPGARLPAVDGVLEVDLGGSVIETVVARLRPAADTGGEQPVLGPTREAAQPAYSRYWLHNRGPAPMGFLPVSVSLSPLLARCAPGGEVEVAVTVASQFTDVAVDVRMVLDLPDGWGASSPEGLVTVAAGGSARFRSWVSVPDGAEAGQYAVSARARPASSGLAGGDGVSEVEDVLTVFVGDSDALRDSLGFALPGMGDLGRDMRQGSAPHDRHRPTGLEVSVATTELVLAPGVASTLEVVLRNTTRSAVRAELQIASPWGTWEWVGEPIRAVTVAAGCTETVAVRVRPPADTVAGHAWLLPKVMWSGRAQYAETVRLEVRR